MLFQIDLKFMIYQYRDFLILKNQKFYGYENRKIL